MEQSDSDSDVVIPQPRPKRATTPHSKQKSNQESVKSIPKQHSKAKGISRAMEEIKMSSDSEYYDAVTVQTMKKREDRALALQRIVKGRPPAKKESSEESAWESDVVVTKQTQKKKRRPPAIKESSEESDWEPDRVIRKPNRKNKGKPQAKKESSEDSDPDDDFKEPPKPKLFSTLQNKNEEKAVSVKPVQNQPSKRKIGSESDETVTKQQTKRKPGPKSRTQSLLKTKPKENMSDQEPCSSKSVQSSSKKATKPVSETNTDTSSDEKSTDKPGMENGKIIIANPPHPTWDAENKILTIYVPGPRPDFKCPFEGCKDTSSSWLSNSNRYRYNNLTAHITKMHNIDKFRVLYQCIACNKHEPTEVARTLNSCMNKYIGEMDPNTVLHDCEICDKSFVTNRQLILHIRIHANEIRGIEADVEETEEDSSKSDNKKSKKQPSKGSRGKSGSTKESKKLLQSPLEKDELDVDEECYEEETDQPEDVIDLDELHTPLDDNVDISEHLENWKSRLYKIRIGFCSPTKWAKFEKLLEDMTKRIQQEFKISPFWLKTHSLTKKEEMDYKETRSLYQRNPKKAVNVILNSTPESCKIPIAEVEAHFIDKFKKPATDIDESYFSRDVSVKHPSMKWFIITEAQVKERLHKFRNTAPGIDKIQYRHWKVIDPNGSLLAIIFNICRKFRKIPKAWKKSKTLLFPKVKDPQTIKDWRAISLLNTIYKLYSAVIADKVKVWCEANKLVDLAQKGGSKFDVILEHYYVMDYHMQNARNTRQNLSFCTAIVDLILAYPSVLLDAVRKIMEKLGFSDFMIEIIMDMLTDRITEILTGAGTTNEIMLERGLLLGDPISGILFVLLLNEAIMAVKNNSPQTSWIKHPILADVDDMTLLADNNKTLQGNVNILVCELNKIHMHLKPEKCVAFAINCSPDADEDEFGITVNGKEIRVLGESEHHKFLGIRIGPKRVNGDTDVIRKIEADCTLIFKSKLAGIQRISAFQQYLIPRFMHELRFGNQFQNVWEDLDLSLRPSLRHALGGLRHSSPLNYLYASKKNGCMGLPMFEDEQYLLNISNVYKLIDSPDPAIRNLIITDAKRLFSLSRLVSLREKSDLEKLVILLNGGMGKVGGSFLGKAIKSSDKLKVTWELLKDSRLGLKYKGVSIPCKDRKKVLWHLRDRIRRDKAKEFKTTTLGIPFSAFEMSPFSNKVISDCRDNRVWNFLHRARLNLLHVRATPSAISQAKKGCKDPLQCRRCSTEAVQPNETLCHVLNRCDSNMPLITDRHNYIQDKLQEKMEEHGFEIKGIDDTIRELASSLRPDLVAVRGDLAYLVDVSIPYDYDDATLRKKAEYKKDHYKKLAEEYLALHKELKTVEVFPFIIGSRGSWYPENNKFLKVIFGEQKKNSRELFSIHCVYMVLKWSRAIAAVHLDNETFFMNGVYPDTETIVEQVKRLELGEEDSTSVKYINKRKLRNTTKKNTSHTPSTKVNS